MTRISTDDVSKVAKLARLDISDDLLELYANQLEKILDYISQLEKINTTNVPPTTRAVEVFNVIRDDVIEQSSIRDDLLELGPNREGDFYRVPKIIAE